MKKRSTFRTMVEGEAFCLGLHEDDVEKIIDLVITKLSNHPAELSRIKLSIDSYIDGVPLYEFGLTSSYIGDAIEEYISKKQKENK